MIVASTARRAIAQLHLAGIALAQRLGQPVELVQPHPVAAQLVRGADHHLAAVGPDRHDVARLRVSARQTASLADRVAGESLVLADHLARRRDERTRRQRGRIGRQVPLQHADVVVVRHEADLHRLGLVRGGEPELAGRAPASRPWSARPTGVSIRATTARSMPQRK